MEFYFQGYCRSRALLFGEKSFSDDELLSSESHCVVLCARIDCEGIELNDYRYAILETKVALYLAYLVVT